MSERTTIETSAPSSVSAQILRPLVDAYLSGRYNDVLKLSNGAASVVIIRSICFLREVHS